MALFEYYSTGADDTRKVTSNYWAQTFTPQLPHTITSVQVYISRTFSPGNLECRIHLTDGAGKPTSVVSYGFVNANGLPTGFGWRQINISAADLDAAEQYALSLHCTTGSDVHYVGWRNDETSPLYAGGKDWNGPDGVSWSSWFGCDFYFREYGTLIEPTGFVHSQAIIIA